MKKASSYRKLNAPSRKDTISSHIGEKKRNVSFSGKKNTETIENGTKIYVIYLLQMRCLTITKI